MRLACSGSRNAVEVAVLPTHLSQEDFNDEQDDGEQQQDSSAEEQQEGAARKQQRGQEALQRFTRNLTEAARKDRLDPLIGRQDIIERTLRVLCKRTKNNPILVGDPGVGKTALAGGIAHRII